MKKAPLVTVVIPFYSNIKGLLFRSVNSALQQTHGDIEVIVVDDASPLKAEHELRSISDDRLLIIRHKTNLNGAIARNTGIDAAKGKFLAFLDYDDFWYKDKILKQINMFYELGNDERNVIYTKCKIVSGKRTFVRPKRKIEESESVAHYLFCSKELIQTSGIFLKTSVARQVKFDNLKRHQDYQFCIGLDRIGCKFYLINSICYEFYQIPKINDFNFSLDWWSKYLHSEHSLVKKGFLLNVVVRSKIQQNYYKDALIMALEYKLSFMQFLYIFSRIIAKKILHFE